MPHHGSAHGTFDSRGQVHWLKHCPTTARLALSTHVQPYQLPDGNVLAEFKRRGLDVLRTDRGYHLTFKTDGTRSEFEYTTKE